METKVFYKKIEMTSNAQQDWRYSMAKQADIDTFCKETESFANSGGYRVVSVIPVTGGIDRTSCAGGTSMTCGFVVVFEKP